MIGQVLEAIVATCFTAAFAFWIYSMCGEYQSIIRQRRELEAWRKDLDPMKAERPLIFAVHVFFVLAFAFMLAQLYVLCAAAANWFQVVVCVTGSLPCGAMICLVVASALYEWRHP